MTTDIRLDIAWAENKGKAEIAACATLDELTKFIVDNNQRLGRLDQGAPSAWEKLRNQMHAKDGELRAKIRDGVG